MRNVFGLLVLLLTAMLVASRVQSGPEPEVLATVGGIEITSAQLERALASSPFAIQFNAMDRDAQAALRGNLLRRLVTSQLLLLEARRLGLDKTEGYLREREEFRLALTYRKYMDRVRADIRIPEATDAEMKRQLRGAPDALAAARSSWRARHYQQTRADVLRRLREQYAVQMHLDRIGPNLTSNTVLLSGTDVEIRYGDIVDVAEHPTPPSREWIRAKLDTRAELLVVGRAAIADGIDVQEQAANFDRERLPARLLEQMEQTWVPDKRTLQSRFDAHSELGRIPEQRHIGQLVLATREEAEAIRQRILAGESLFVLAGEHSIDPYGRQRNGDMGWLKEGSASPEIEQSIAGLKDREISTVIETPKGFHVVTILERRRGTNRPFEAVEDRVRQDLIAERMTEFIKELEKRYPVEWQLLASQGQ